VDAKADKEAQMSEPKVRFGASRFGIHLVGSLKGSGSMVTFL